MIPDFIDRSRLPHKSGVYLFKNACGDVLYVGKAIDLYHRVAGYFTGAHDVKTKALVDDIRNVETIIVESELEALILEANLIKKHLPPFNVRLRDDKDYLYIGITKEDSPRSAGGAGFPKVVTIRKKDLKSVRKYFGPFPSAKTVRNTLRMLRRVFPWCSSASPSQTRRACFYYHLGLCPGACVGLISRQDYHKIISRFAKFLEGRKEKLLEELIDDMKKASKEQKFEDALKIKKMIEGINYLTQTNRVEAYLENPNFLEDQHKLALAQLRKDLNLATMPKRIEGYDISNIQGQQATGSMVVLSDGEIDKSQYRKFRIHISGRPDDVGMHKEMMKRRLKNNWPLPDLILVDGGRGQAKGVWEAMKQSNNLTIPIYGLAKKMEWLYPPEGEIIKLSNKSLSLKLLQKIRDEAHRFAVTYHRKLRDKILFQ